MKFRQIEIFKEVMSTGTVTAASERLNVSAPAISQMLRDFEESIAVKLFERVKGRLVPTTEAHLFLEEVNRVWGGFEQLKNFSEDLREFRSRQLELGVFPGLSKSWLAGILKEFMEIHEGITVTIRDVNSSQVIENARSRQIDFGLSLMPIDDPAVYCEEINATRSFCIVPRKHPLAKLDVVSPGDIADYPFISLSDLDFTKTRIQKLFEDAGVEPRVVMQVCMSATACHLVSNNLGVAIVDEKSANDHSHLDICAIPLEPGITFSVYMVKPVSGRASDLADKFMAHVCDRIDY